MKVTVLGSSGAFPTAQNPSSGFLVEHDGYTLLLDAGYSIFPRLLTHLPVEALDAVYITHGHPDHCADLSPLLRARARVSGGSPHPALPVFAPQGALDAVLKLDRAGMLEQSLHLTEFHPGDVWDLGPFRVSTAPLPHWWPNAAVRLDTADSSMVYTGDGGPHANLTVLAHQADLLIAEASFADIVPAQLAGRLSSATDAGTVAATAECKRLWLTHLMPETSPRAALRTAMAHADMPVQIATPDLTMMLGRT